MVHGSFENHTSRSRRAVVLNVFRDGVVSASDLPPLEGVSPIAAGQKMDGQFFPLLLDPKKYWPEMRSSGVCRFVAAFYIARLRKLKAATSRRRTAPRTIFDIRFSNDVCGAIYPSSKRATPLLVNLTWSVAFN
jgi:hypothetical protein